MVITEQGHAVDSFGARDHRLTATLNGVPSNVYLLGGDGESLVIDSAFGVGDLRRMTHELADSDGRLLLTHTHWDHIGAGHQFDRAHVHPAESTSTNEVRIDSLSDEFVGRPAQFVGDHVAAGRPLPDEFDSETFDVPPITDVEPVEPDETIEMGDRTLELVGLPGHSPGQLGVLDRERDVLYGGDVVHGDRNLYVHFEDCDIERYIDTFDRVIALRDRGAFSTLMTGHNPPIAGEDLSILDELRDALETINDGERTPEPVDTDWGEKHRYRIGDTEILTKLSV